MLYCLDETYYSKLVHTDATTKVWMGMALPQCREAVRAKPAGAVSQSAPYFACLCSLGAGNGHNHNYDHDH